MTTRAWVGAIRRIVSSDETKALETAEVLAAALGIGVERARRHRGDRPFGGRVPPAGRVRGRRRRLLRRPDEQRPGLGARRRRPAADRRALADVLADDRPGRCRRGRPRRRGHPVVLPPRRHPDRPPLGPTRPGPRLHRRPRHRSTARPLAPDRRRTRTVDRDRQVAGRASMASSSSSTLIGPRCSVATEPSAATTSVTGNDAAPSASVSPPSSSTNCSNVTPELVEVVLGLGRVLTDVDADEADVGPGHADLLERRQLPPARSAPRRPQVDDGRPGERRRGRATARRRSSAPSSAPAAPSAPAPSSPEQAPRASDGGHGRARRCRLTAPRRAPRR